MVWLFLILSILTVGTQAWCPCQDTWRTCITYSGSSRNEICNCIDIVLPCSNQTDCDDDFMNRTPVICELNQCKGCQTPQQICMFDYLECMQQTCKSKDYLCFCTRVYHNCLHSGNVDDSMGIINHMFQVHSCEWCF